MKSIIIGIAGGSGSGKSTLARSVKERFGEDKSVILSHDSYYRNQDHKAMAERLETNYDHPDSLETELLVKHLQQLKSGQSIDVPEYDFERLTRADTTRKLDPAPLIIVEGILIFTSQKLRDECALKVFVDVPADIRLIRRIRRDIEVRHRTWEYTLRIWEERVHPMHTQFVEPSKQTADVVVTQGGLNEAGIMAVLNAIDDSNE